MTKRKYNLLLCPCTHDDLLLVLSVKVIPKSLHCIGISQMLSEQWMHAPCEYEYRKCNGFLTNATNRWIYSCIPITFYGYWCARNSLFFPSLILQSVLVSRKNEGQKLKRIKFFCVCIIYLKILRKTENILKGCVLFQKVYLFYLVTNQLRLKTKPYL